jgi:hypothetical protein
MKSELSNIKQDFEKVIKKDINLKGNTPLTLNNGNKAKYCTSDRKEPRVLSNYEKYEVTSGWKEYETKTNNILQLEKNLPCSSSRAANKTIDNFKSEKPGVNKYDEIEFTIVNNNLKK